MAHSLSAKKRIRQNSKLNTRNRARRAALKTRTRKVVDALASGDASAAATKLLEATRAMDREAVRGTLHPNAAARRKSRMAKKLNALKANAGK